MTVWELIKWLDQFPQGQDVKGVPGGIVVQENGTDTAFAETD